MRRLMTILVGCLVLLSPQAALADQFVFHLDVDTGGGFEFDADSFRMTVPFRADLGNESVGGSVDLVSGPLLSVVVSGDESESFYTYGPGGLVSITASWTCGGERWPCDIGLPAEGSYTGVFESLGISLCEICGATFPGATGDVSAILGPGLFSPTFAYLLSVLGPSLGGSLCSMPVDGVLGEPGSTRLRIGGSGSGSAELSVDAEVVPEPGVTALTLVSAAALLINYSRTRRRHWAFAPPPQQAG